MEEEENVPWLESIVKERKRENDRERRRAGDGCRMVIDREREKDRGEQKREKGSVVGTTCTYVRVCRGRISGRRRESKVREVEGMCSCRNYQGRSKDWRCPCSYISSTGTK